MADGVWENISREMNSRGDVLQDFTDGDIFKHHKLFRSQQCVLRIYLYTDEFEITMVG